jgi:cytidylate kinase
MEILNGRSLSQFYIGSKDVILDVE